MAGHVNPPTIGDMPECPSCGYQEQDAWEWDFGPGLDGEAEVDCARCGASLFVQRTVTTTYSTSVRKSAPTPVQPIERECSSCGYAPCMCDQQ